LAIRRHALSALEARHRRTVALAVELLREACWSGLPVATGRSRSRRTRGCETGEILVGDGARAAALQQDENQDEGSETLRVF
jgi:hypothetical protein